MRYSLEKVKSWYAAGITLLILLTIATPLISKKISQISAGLVLIASITSCLLIYSRILKARPLTLPEKKMIQACLFIFLIYLTNVILLGDFNNSGAKTDQYIYLLLPIFIFPLLRLISISSFMLANTFCIISAIAGILSIIELSLTGGRTGYIFHGQPIPFGNLALLCGFSCLAFLDLNNKKSKNLTLIICSLLAIFASISSQTRGGFIAIPVLTILTVWFNKEYFFRRKVAISTIGFIFILFIITLSTPIFKKIETRINLAFNETESYYQEKAKETSVGIRLDLWKIAIDGWKESPIFGNGITEYYTYKDERLKDQLSQSHLLTFKHTHNEYIGILFSQGIIGLLIFLTMIYKLSIYYFRKAKNSTAALIGLLINSGYLIFSLTESFFSLNTSLLFFITLNSVLISLLSQQHQNSGVSQHAA